MLNLHSAELFSRSDMKLYVLYYFIVRMLDIGIALIVKQHWLANDSSYENLGVVVVFDFYLTISILPDNWPFQINKKSSD